MKFCSGCKTKKDRSEYYAHYCSKDGLHSQCKSCMKKNWAKYAKTNKSRIQNIVSKYQARNITKVRASTRTWQMAHPEAMRAIAATRRARKLRATPAWASKEVVAEYKRLSYIAKEIEEIAGIKCQIDHIYPLKGHNSCGLHVAHNLQLLTEFQNKAKSNKDPEIIGVTVDKIYRADNGRIEFIRAICQKEEW